MAQRRMFAKAVVGKGRFLRLPEKSRLLYFELGMDADDDGFVEAFTVIQKHSANEEDLDALIEKGFVRMVIEDDMVVHITDWSTNNQIRKDRYTPSIYRGYLPESDVGNQMATNGQPDGNQMATQKRKGKERSGKVSPEKEREEKAEGALLFFQENFSGFSDSVQREIEEICDQMGEEVVKSAMQTAIQSGKKSWGYCKGILKNWQQSGGGGSSKGEKLPDGLPDHLPDNWPRVLVNPHSNMPGPTRPATPAEKAEMDRFTAYNQRQLKKLLENM